MDKNKRKVTLLCLLWIVSMILAYVGFGILKIRSLLEQSADNDSNNLWDILPVALIPCYFYPLLCVIRKYAMLAQMPKILKITKSLIVLFRMTLVVFPIALVFYLTMQR